MATDQRLSFGALLKRYRRAAELSQEQLAERAGYSAVYVRKLEGGARRPTASTVELLAHALDLEAEERAALQEAAQRASGVSPGSPLSAAPPVEQLIERADVHAFLIADIRGYTRFTQERGDEAAARITTAFATIARETVGVNGGEVIELRGDEVLAVFASSRGALRAALALRNRCREIAETDATLPLHVGIGLDAGEAVPVEGGYRGGALNLAARLCSLAGPGEVFASETVVGLARKIDDVAYRERGRVQLKGYAEPVSVVEVLPEGELEVLTRRETFDAVLATGGAATEIVERIAAKLQDAGLRVWTRGQEPADLATALRLTRRVLVFVGPAGLENDLRDQLTVALDPLGAEWHPRVSLVLLPGSADPFDPAILPPFLSTRVWIDFRGDIPEGVEATAQLVHAIEGASEAERPSKALADIQPYRGLEAFDEASAQFFFGRDADVQRLVERLKASCFLAVVGPSGSGKSSLAKAGLVPSLRSGSVRDSESWTIKIITPGTRPLTALAVQLIRLYPQDTMQRTLDEMVRDSRTLHLATLLALADRPPNERIVWVIDQFEEIFTLCHDEKERRQFLANLLHAASVPDSRTVVILTMRADFYPRAAQYPELAARIAAEQYLVGPMEREGFRQVVEEPAWRVGLEFEQGLVDRILEDVANQAGALPLLEYALLELWQRREGHILTLEGYRESGGVHGAIARRAELTFSRFSVQEQAISRRVLLRLTQTGEGTADTRRRASVSELVTQTGSSKAVEQVVNALVDARLLTAGRADAAGERQIEVSHEALIRGWPRLRQWIDEDRAGLRIHRRLTESAQEWLRLGKDRSSLYRGATLAIALEWAQRNPDALNEWEQEFLDAGVETQEQERRAARRRVWLSIGGLVAVLLVVSVTAVFALIQQRQAVHDRNAALSVLWAQNATTLLSGGSRTTAILVAVEAVRESLTDAAVSALRDALAQFPVSHVLQGHENAVVSAAYSPDSRRIVTASADGTAIVWDAQSARELRVLNPRAGALNDAEFSPDGRAIATAGADGTARIWESGSGRQLHILRGHTMAVASAVYSPDGRWIVTASLDRTARIWDASTGRPVRVLRGHAYAVRRAVFSPDSREIISSSDDGTARVWDTRTGRLQRVLPVSRGQEITSAAFSPDGRQALTSSTAVGTYGGGAGVAQVWDLTRPVPQAVESLREPRGFVAFAAFSPDGKWIVTATNQPSVARVWDARTGLMIAVLRGHTASVNMAEFSPDERSVVTASVDGTALTHICDVCGSVNDLLARAHQQVHRSLTPTERRIYLSQP